jgi:tetratricopeptide (TPR) repeat protein
VKYIWRLADSLRHDRKNVEADHLYEQLLPRLIKSPAWEGYNREILDARTQHAALLGDQGSLLIEQEKWVEAEAVFRRLVQLRELINPSGAIDALIQLGTILQEQGKWSEAEGICGQISELLKKFNLKGRKNKKMRKRVVRLRKLEDMIKKQEKVCKVEDVWKSVLELRPEADEV